jgi:hypothetical protein
MSLQERCEPQHERGLAGSADRNVSDDDDRHADAV